MKTMRIYRPPVTEPFVMHPDLICGDYKAGMPGQYYMSAIGERVDAAREAMADSLESFIMWLDWHGTIPPEAYFLTSEDW